MLDNVYSGSDPELLKLMTESMPNQIKKRDRSNENFLKRWRTLMKSGYDVHTCYGTDVYILLRRRGRNFEFKSTDTSWPTSPEDIVTSHSLPLYSRILKCNRGRAILCQSG